MVALCLYLYALVLLLSVALASYIPNPKTGWSYVWRLLLVPVLLPLLFMTKIVEGH